MPIEIITSIIALVGVFLSVSISIYTSRRQTKTDLTKFHFEIRQNFNTILFEKRLEIYPAIYATLIELSDNIKYREVTKDAIVKMFNPLQMWREYSFLFTAKTGHLAFELKEELLQLAEKPDGEFQEFINDLDARNKLRQKVQKVELALKSELGIYGFRSPTIISNSTEFQTYDDAVNFKKSQQEDAY